MKQSTVLCCFALMLTAVAAAGCTSTAASDGPLASLSGGTANARKDIDASTRVPTPSGPATQFPHCNTGSQFCP